MIRRAAWMLMILLLSAGALVAQDAPTEPPFLDDYSAFDLDALRTLPVLDQGRYKPLDSWAREELYRITGSRSWDKRDPVVTLLLMVALNVETWSDQRMLECRFQELRDKLGVSDNEPLVSYSRVRNSAELGMIQRDLAMSGRAQNSDTWTDLELKANELMGRVERFLEIIQGMKDLDGGRRVPISIVKLVAPPDAYPDPLVGGKPTRTWFDPMRLPDDLLDAEKRTRIRGAWEAVLMALVQGNADMFNAALADLKAELATTGATDGPTERALSLEVWNNKNHPYMMSAAFYLIAGVAAIFALTMKGAWIYILAWISALIGLGYHSFGQVIRTIAAQRPFVSNMYESVIWMIWAMIVTAIVLELIYRKRIYMVVGGLLCTFGMVLIDRVPIDPAINTLMPVLNSHYWLIIHVLTIVASYGILGIAAGIAHVWLFNYMASPARSEFKTSVSKAHYLVMGAGTCFLGIGIMLGAVWANESWGRYWGWDPKETWALIALIGYLAVMHGRIAGWMGDFAVACGSILSFVLIMITYYAVNFLPAFSESLHSYAGGSRMEVPLPFTIYLIAEGVLLAVAIGFRYLRPTRLDQIGTVES
jgi:ABC-type transport system involved in cytochrome c biogenesis permease subunit